MNVDLTEAQIEYIISALNEELSIYRGGPSGEYEDIIADHDALIKKLESAVWEMEARNVV